MGLGLCLLVPFLWPLWGLMCSQKQISFKSYANYKEVFQKYLCFVRLCVQPWPNLGTSSCGATVTSSRFLTIQGSRNLDLWREIERVGSRNQQPQSYQPVNQETLSWFVCVWCVGSETTSQTLEGIPKASQGRCNPTLVFLGPSPAWVNQQGSKSHQHHSIHSHSRTQVLSIFWSSEDLSLGT